MAAGGAAAAGRLQRRVADAAAAGLQPTFGAGLRLGPLGRVGRLRRASKSILSPVPDVQTAAK